MSNYLNISSGAKFTNKIFGTPGVSKKPAIIKSGKIFAENVFQNQKILPRLENNPYYSNHGLINDDVIIDYSILASFSDDLVEEQSITFSSLALQNSRSRGDSAMINLAQSNLSGFLNTNISITNPYDNNSDPPCTVP